MPYGSIQCFIAIHPKGDYMYIMVRNKHVIYRADYDFDEKTFTTPYLVCGKYEASGIVDGVGGNVRMNEPVSYTHLDVYKRQAYSSLHIGDVRDAGIAF